MYRRYLLGIHVILRSKRSLIDMGDYDMYYPLSLMANNYHRNEEDFDQSMPQYGKYMLSDIGLQRYALQDRKGGIHYIPNPDDPNYDYDADHTSDDSDNDDDSDDVDEDMKEPDNANGGDDEEMKEPDNATHHDFAEGYDNVTASDEEKVYHEAMPLTLPAADITTCATTGLIVS